MKIIQFYHKRCHRLAANLATLTAVAASRATHNPAGGHAAEARNPVDTNAVTPAACETMPDLNLSDENKPDASLTSSPFSFGTSLLLLFLTLLSLSSSPSATPKYASLALSHKHHTPRQNNTQLNATNYVGGENISTRFR
jgi:hypothetical protein